MNNKSQMISNDMELSTCLTIGHDSITISVSRFAELVVAESELRVLRSAYHNLQKFELIEVMAAVFGPKSKDEVV